MLCYFWNKPKKMLLRSCYKNTRIWFHFTRRQNEWIREKLLKSEWKGNKKPEHIESEWNGASNSSGWRLKEIVANLLHSQVTDVNEQRSMKREWNKINECFDINLSHRTGCCFSYFKQDEEWKVLLQQHFPFFSKTWSRKNFPQSFNLFLRNVRER